MIYNKVEKLVRRERVETAPFFVRFGRGTEEVRQRYGECTARVRRKFGERLAREMYNFR